MNGSESLYLKVNKDSYMNTTNRYSLFIGDEKIAELASHETEFPQNKETGWKLYMRRKNKIYFKSPFGKRVLELKPIPEELNNIKYGEVCVIKWS